MKDPKMVENEKSEVEKLARLVRRILLTIIWLGAIGIVVAFVGGFAAGFSSPE